MEFSRYFVEKFCEKTWRNTKKNSGILFQFFKWKKKTTHKNTHTQQQHHMGPLSRKIQCQIIEVQKLGIKKKKSPNTFLLKKITTFFLLRNLL